MCLCLCACLSLASGSSDTVEVTIVRQGTVTASDTRMHHVFITLTLTFIQGHTDRNHENTKCWIVSNTIQAMTITFAVKIVRLRVYNYDRCQSDDLDLIQDHKCASNVTTF